MPTNTGAKTADRRQRKSRAALEQALLQLIATKPYESITIEDVTEAADVARATFYAHFKDKAALLRSANQQLIGELAARAGELAPRDPPRYTGAGVTVIFRHARDHDPLYRLVLSGEGGAEPRAELIQAFRQAVSTIFSALSKGGSSEPRPSPSLITGAFVGALVLTLEGWLAGDFPGEADELAADFIKQQVKGLEWALGFEPGAWTFIDLQGQVPPPT